MTRSVIEYESTEEDIQTPCKVCDMVYDGGKSMVQCNKCDEWNHHKCVGMAGPVIYAECTNRHVFTMVFIFIIDI